MKNFTKFVLFISVSISFVVSSISAYADTSSNLSSIGSVDISMASPVEGSPNAPITMIEFGDYQCPHCDAWFKNTDPTIKSNYIDTNKVKLYFVDIPYLGPDSAVAAEATYCASDQGKYWEYHDMLYTNQGPVQSGWAGSDSLKQFASNLGLDTAKFNTCLDSGKYSDRVSHNKDVATSAGVQGTPTFFIVSSNGTVNKIEGDQPTTVYSNMIDSMYTQPTPEFGPVVTVVLVIGIASIIGISSKMGLRFLA